ncbi:NAD(+)/NADH kinase [soil metagenome]
MTLRPRVVMVHRRTELDDLVARHGTLQQAAFFLRSRDRSLEEVQLRHGAQQRAVTHVGSAIPLDWRRGQVERVDLERFVFGPEDIIVAVGQDGLVANVAKYLDGQPVVGVNPEPGRHPGLLVPHPPHAISALFAGLSASSVDDQLRTMVQATTDDGQMLLALNEVYVGHPSHQSARYRIQTAAGGSERQSSSGVLVGTGTGSSGWCLSVWRERHSRFPLPTPEQPGLCWFVREAWPSPATGIDLTEGTLGPDQHLVIVAESELVLFGDGIETDAIALTWGQRVTFGLAEQRLRLIV